MSLRNSTRNVSPNVSSSFRLPPALDTVLKIGMDYEQRLESNRPQKTMRQNTDGRFNPLVTDMEIVIRPPIYFQSPTDNLKEKDDGFSYGNVPIVEDRKEWPIERFSYQTNVDQERATPVKLKGTLDAIARQISAYTYKGAPILDAQYFFQVLNVLNLTVFTGGEAEAALNKNTKELEFANQTALIGELQNHKSEVTLPLLFFVYNALSRSSSKETTPGLDSALVAAGILDKNLFELWYQVYTLLNALTEFENWPLVYKDHIKLYISDLYNLDPRPDTVLSLFGMGAAQDPGYGFDEEDEEEDDNAMQE